MSQIFARRAVTIRNIPFISSSRLASTLALIETTAEGYIETSSLNLLNAAKQLKNPIVALFVGPQAATGAENLKANIKCQELNKIIIAKDESLDHYLPENVSPLIADLLKDDEYSHFVVASSSVGKNILPRVGALIDNQPICDVTEIQAPNKFIRPIYAGNALKLIECPQNKKLLSVRTSAFASIENGKSDTSEIIEIPYTSKPSSSIKWISTNLTQTGRPDLGSARIVVAGGRAFKDKETFDKILTPLADTLKAGIGATRAAVDNGLCDNSLQIGQTGKIVAPSLYIALGLSGAVQHLAGMKDSGVIVAINNDPDAPIFKNSDYGLEGDVFDIVPELTEKIKITQNNA